MTRRPLRSALRRMTGDGVSFSVMVGAGETYIPAFALALGLADAWAGLLATLPMAVGGLVQLGATRATRRFGCRPVVVAGAVLQALSFLPLVAGAIAGRLEPAVLFACAGLYWAAGLSTTGAWSTWAGQLVPRTIRAAYFGRRQGLMQLGVLAGLLGAGLILELGGAQPLAAFAAVFALAAAARAASSGFLLGYPVAAAPAAGVGRVRDAWRSAERRWMLLVVGLHMSVAVAAPFFTPFMLRQASMSYGQYTVLTAAVFVAKVAALPAIGRRACGRSATTLVAASALGIAATPIWWLVSDDFWYLLVAQLVAGVFWAGLELGIQLGFFELSNDRDRAGLVSLYNGCHSVGAAVATAGGAALLAALGSDRRAFFAVFVVSAVARFGAAALLVAHARGLSLAIWRVPLRTLAVRPAGGSLMAPVLAALPRRRSGAPAPPVAGPNRPRRATAQP